MSLEQDLEQIAGDKSHRNRTVYRRRDLRNGLANRLGISERDRDPQYRNRNAGSHSKRQFSDRRVNQVPSKKLLRIKNIPLDVGDFQVEDWVKEFGELESVRIHDKRDARVGSFEFKDASVLEAALEGLNGKEVNEVKLEVEIFETGGARGNRRDRPREKQAGRKPPPAPAKTKEELDQEMEDYMAQD